MTQLADAEHDEYQLEFGSPPANKRLSARHVRQNGRRRSGIHGENAIDFTLGLAMTTTTSLPDWLMLMRQWLEQKMGNTGITLPFLAGALALKRGQKTVSAGELRSLLDRMTSSPFLGYFVGVRRCGNIHAPVLSSLPLNDPLIRQCELFAPDGQVSFAFSPDAMSPFGGLDCNCAADCIEKLVQYSAPYTEAGNFSRVYDEHTKGFIYSTFRSKEVKFIRSVLGD